MGEYFTFINETVAAGKFVTGEELAPSHTATTVRVRLYDVLRRADG